MVPAVLDALVQAREGTLGLVAHPDDANLERVVDPIMSPLAWDLGHIAAYEDLWINHRLGGQPLVRSDLAVLYHALATPRTGRANPSVPPAACGPPRAGRGTLRSLRGEPLRAYLDDVRERALEVDPGDGFLHEL